MDSRKVSDVSGLTDCYNNAAYFSSRIARIIYLLFHDYVLLAHISCQQTCAKYVHCMHLFNIAIAGCMSIPCLNGGWCLQLPGNRYKCKCPFGFTGPNCEYRTLLVLFASSNANLLVFTELHYVGIVKLPVLTVVGSDTGGLRHHSHVLLSWLNCWLA